MPYNNSEKVRKFQRGVGAGLKLRDFLKSAASPRILISRTDRIGDVVLSLPLVKILRNNFPQSFLSFMVCPYTKSLVEGNPYLDKVLVYDKRNTHRSIRGSFGFLCNVLRKERFDVALMLHPTNRVHLLCFLAGIPFRVGFDIKLGFLNNIRIVHDKHLGRKHELEYNFQFLDVLGIEERTVEFYLPVKEEKEEAAEEIFQEAGLRQDDMIIGVNPTASCLSKIWPPEYFAELVNRLVNSGCKIVLVGSEDRREIVELLRQKLKYQVLDLIGKTDIPLLISVLKRIRLFVSCDSGPVHIANALGKKCVVIYGRNQPGLSPQRWRPYGKGHILFHRDVGCEVCLAHNCRKNFACLRSISVDEVFKAVREYCFLTED